METSHKKAASTSWTMNEEKEQLVGNETCDLTEGSAGPWATEKATWEGRLGGRQYKIKEQQLAILWKEQDSRSCMNCEYSDHCCKKESQMNIHSVPALCRERERNFVLGRLT